MEKLIVSKNSIKRVELTEEEIAVISEEQTLEQFEQSLQPSTEAVEDAEFELKLITKLTEWGII